MYPKGTVSLLWKRNKTVYLTPKRIAILGGLASFLYIIFISVFDVSYKLSVYIHGSFKNNGQVISSLDALNLAVLGLYIPLLLLNSVWIYGQYFYSRQKKTKNTFPLFYLSFIVIFVTIIAHYVCTGLSTMYYHF